MKLKKRQLVKAFYIIFGLTLVAVPLTGCGGVESEPVGVPEDDDGLEGVDLSLER